MNISSWPLCLTVEYRDTKIPDRHHLDYTPCAIPAPARQLPQIELTRDLQRALRGNAKHLGDHAGGHHGARQNQIDQLRKPGTAAPTDEPPLHLLLREQKTVVFLQARLGTGPDAVEQSNQPGRAVAAGAQGLFRRGSGAQGRGGSLPAGMLGDAGGRHHHCAAAYGDTRRVPFTETNPSTPVSSVATKNASSASFSQRVK